ncbi:MAG: hypothetical protein KKB25_03340 [Nanoarchaeota archaeon]|nr:hypothetical protein [bacterium]MBU3958085.1 hypothetical protein [Nanoarchaeota archaeon]
MPRKAARKQPKTDDGIIREMNSYYNKFFVGFDSDVEKKLLAATLDVKFEEDIRYLRAAAAFEVAIHSRKQKGKEILLNVNEIKTIYSGLGNIPEKFRSDTKYFYKGLILKLNKVGTEKDDNMSYR